MEKFKVLVKFPKDKSGNTVSVTGLEENLEDAKEHLMMLAEDYVSDIDLLMLSFYLSFFSVDARCN